MYQVRIESRAGHVHESVTTYDTKDEARAEIRRIRTKGDGCRYWIVPA